MAQRPVTDPMATGTENLALAGLIQGMCRRDAHARARADRPVRPGRGGRQVKTYSGGMARKLDVALGLMHRPQVLFLDEPTTGLDPQTRTEMWTEITAMAASDGVTVLLTTHHLDEADRLAARLAIVDAGRIVAQGSPDALKSQLRGDTVVFELAEPDERVGAAVARAASPGTPSPGRTGSSGWCPGPARSRWRGRTAPRARPPASRAARSVSATSKVG